MVGVDWVGTLATGSVSVGPVAVAVTSGGDVATTVNQIAKERARPPARSGKILVWLEPVVGRSAQQPPR